MSTLPNREIAIRIPENVCSACSIRKALIAKYAEPVITETRFRNYVKVRRIDQNTNNISRFIAEEQHAYQEDRRVNCDVE